MRSSHRPQAETPTSRPPRPEVASGSGDAAGAAHAHRAAAHPARRPPPARGAMMASRLRRIRSSSRSRPVSAAVFLPRRARAPQQFGNDTPGGQPGGMLGVGGAKRRRRLRASFNDLVAQLAVARGRVWPVWTSSRYPSFKKLLSSSSVDEAAIGELLRTRRQPRRLHHGRRSSGKF